MYDAKGRAPRDRVIEQHIPLVKKLAYQLKARLPANVEVDDLIQAGTIGLLDAMSRYEATQNAQFETYAVQRIRGAMLDELRSQDWLPRSVRQNMRQIEAALGELQQELLRPDEYSVIATLNLNGDYVSDALAAQVGGIGIAPGANLSDSVAMFEATHGTAPKYAGKDYVNPGSEILSAEMMLRHMGWVEAADLIISSMEKSILSKRVTYDFARLLDGATQVSCSGFGEVMIEHM